jgi:hypothetical protein
VGRVTPHAGGLHIAQPIQQPLQRPGVTVDIPNNVVHDFPQNDVLSGAELRRLAVEGED